MDAHEMVHQLAIVSDQIDKAIKALAPYYATEPGVNIKEHLMTANAYLGGIESKLLHELIGEKK